MEKIEKLKNKSNRYRIFKGVITKYLESYTEGHLKIKLQDGETIEVGNKESENTAIINVHNPIFFKKVVITGDIGFAESYMDGDWSTPDLKEIFLWAIKNIEHSGLISGTKKKKKSINLLAYTNKINHLLNSNTLNGSKRNISYHYDLSNKFYEYMLDPTMTYSCGVFDQSNDLESSQIRKYELITKSLGVKNGDSVLEIGCGWGGYARYLNEQFDNLDYTGVTISKEQLEFAKNSLNKMNLKNNSISFEFEDYRNLTGKFDKIVSIEMIEAVGHNNYPEYFNKIDELLTKNGVATIQAITSPDSRYDQIRTSADFIQKHIFPGSLLPSIRAITNACIDNSLHIFEIKDIGLHYAKTLNKWHEYFLKHWGEIEDLGFNDVFKRKWSYYLRYCEAAFETRNISTQQITLIKPNNTTHHQLEVLK